MFGSFDEMRFWMRALVVFFFAVAAASAEPLPVGRGRVEFPLGDAPLTLFTYKPAGYKDGPLLVVFHGVARNRACFELAQKLAKERGWAFNWRKVESPGIEHDAAAMFAANEVADALFGPK